MSNHDTKLLVDHFRPATPPTQLAAKTPISTTRPRSNWRCAVTPRSRSASPSSWPMPLSRTTATASVAEGVMMLDYTDDKALREEIFEIVAALLHKSSQGFITRIQRDNCCGRADRTRRPARP